MHLKLGTVYRITCDVSDVTYVGSTLRSIDKRLLEHISDSRAWAAGSAKRSCSIFPHIVEHGAEHFKIEVIKQYRVVDARHLRVYETLWIKQTPNTCNHNEPFQIRRLWMRRNYARNRERMLKRQRDHYRANRTQINERQRARYQANRKQVSEYQRKYRQAHREQVLRQQRKYRQAHRSLINARQREYRRANHAQVSEYQRDYVRRHHDQISARETVRHDCTCGGRYTHHNRLRHMSSKRHLRWAAEQ